MGTHTRGSRRSNRQYVWLPTAEEVEAIVAEMRPVIDALAARDQAELVQIASRRATRVAA